MPTLEDIERLIRDVEELKSMAEDQGNQRIVERAEKYEAQLQARLADLTRAEELVTTAMALAITRCRVRRHQREEEEDVPTLH